MIKIYKYHKSVNKHIFNTPNNNTQNHRHTFLYILISYIYIYIYIFHVLKFNNLSIKKNYILKKKTRFCGKYHI